MKQAFDFSAARTSGITAAIRELSADRILLELAKGSARNDKRILVPTSDEWGDFTGSPEFKQFRDEILERSNGACKGITYKNGDLFFWLVKPTKFIRFWYEPDFA